MTKTAQEPFRRPIALGRALGRALRRGFGSGGCDLPQIGRCACHRTPKQQRGQGNGRVVSNLQSHQESHEMIAPRIGPKEPAVSSESFFH